MRTIIVNKLKRLPANLPFTPTSFVTNGSVTPPVPGLPVNVIPICPMIKGEPGVLQNDWRMALAADALILEGRNDHLYRCARRTNLQVYAPAYDQREDVDLFASMSAAAPEPEVDLFGGADLFAGSGEMPGMWEQSDLTGGETDLFAG